MPTVTIYIREEDYAIWQSIEKKSDWLHRVLAAYKQKKQLKELPDHEPPGDD